MYPLTYNLRGIPFGNPQCSLQYGLEMSLHRMSHQMSTIRRCHRKISHPYSYGLPTASTKQWCIADCNPDTPCMKNSSSHNSCHRLRLCNQYDEAGSLICTRRCSDVTCCNGIDMPPHGPLCANMMLSIKLEVHNVSLHY